MKSSRYLAAALALAVLPLALAVARPSQPSRYLVVWAMEVHNPHAHYSLTPGGTAPLGLGRDFLAVYDLAPSAKAPAKLVAMLPAGPASFVHHTNYALPPNGILYANDWLGNRTYVFDLRNPLRPALLRQFRSVGAYGWPHSFAYLPNHDTLATFQFAGGFNHAPGGLVEFGPGGQVVRSSSAAVEGYPYIRLYSLAVVASLNRVVTGSAPMAAGSHKSRVVQIWRLSDLKLLKTLELPGGATNAFEPRLLADGKTVVVPSTDCNLFLVRGLGGRNPSLEHIFNFGYTSCDVPAVAGNYYLQTSTRGEALVSLDVSDPAHPRLVNRLALPKGDKAHWVAVEPGGTRVAITGFGAMITQVLFASLDRHSGQLRLEPQTLELGTRSWPDGWHGAAIPHAAIFTNP
ncbi:MAG: hypothetical protein ACRD01_02550 [Terriglobales bacterium]